MIITKTQNPKHPYTINNSKKNTYTCPSCSHEINFGMYIPSVCEKCSKEIFNIEKLLNDNTDISKVNYYINERI